MGGGGECTAHVQGMRGGLQLGGGCGITVTTARSPPSTPTDAEKQRHPTHGGGVGAAGGAGGCTGFC